MTSPQVFNGFAEPMPRIVPGAMLGVIVSAVVGEYLATHGLLPLAVPVFSPGPLLRDATGVITGCSGLVEYKPPSHAGAT